MSAAAISYRPRVSYSANPPVRTSHSEKTLSLSTRPLYLRGNVTSQSTGSATCELGRTKVICSIHGPRPRQQGGRAEFSGRGAIDVEATFVHFGEKQMSTKEELERKSRELASFLENCLESCVQLSKFPKSVLDIHVVVLEDDGSSFACATLAASYALAKAGVEMVDIITCCTLFVSESGEICVDPDWVLERDAKVMCTIGFLAQSGKVVCFESSGSQSQDVHVLSKLIETGAKVCSELAHTMRTQLKHEALEDFGMDEREV